MGGPLWVSFAPHDYMEELSIQRNGTPTRVPAPHPHLPRPYNNIMQQSSQTQQRRFTASEVAEYEYCPLVWWHEQYEPLSKADTEELFARLVEMVLIKVQIAEGVDEFARSQT